MATGTKSRRPAGSEKEAGDRGLVSPDRLGPSGHSALPGGAVFTSRAGRDPQPHALSEPLREAPSLTVQLLGPLAPPSSRRTPGNFSSRSEGASSPTVSGGGPGPSEQKSILSERASLPTPLGVHRPGHPEPRSQGAAQTAGHDRRAHPRQGGVEDGAAVLPPTAQQCPQQPVPHLGPPQHELRQREGVRIKCSLHLNCFYFLAAPPGTQDPNSPASEVCSPNHRTARKVPNVPFTFIKRSYIQELRTKTKW